ncbi:hypothetical protein K2Q16_00865 [Patescibacteria group bacterium]|nr:hypothetical protein [Patescibacteria group bacterium]
MSSIKPALSVSYLAKNLGIIVGIVLIWRGIWIVLDAIDIYFFGESPLYIGVLGIIAGFLILYLPDRDLKEIEKL